MASEKEFTDRIITLSLKVLKEEHGWNDQLVSKILELHNADNLINMKNLSSAFEEIAVSKEVENND